MKPKQNNDTHKPHAKLVILDEYQMTILNNVIILRDYKNNVNKSKFLLLHTFPLGGRSINTWMISGIAKPC